MDELQLLNRFVDFKKSSDFLSLQIQLWEDGKERNEFIRQKKDVDTQISDLKVQLEGIEDKKFSLAAKQNMIEQMRVYIQNIGNRRMPIHLSRYENIFMTNSLFINLAGHIKNIAIGRQMGIHIPFLEFTYTDPNSIEIEFFLEFLNQEILNIRNIEIVNFVNLNNYYLEFQQRLISRFL